VEIRVLCRNIFKELEILPLTSQYIFSLLMVVLKNITLFPSNLHCHTIETRQRQNLYLPQTNIMINQKGLHYEGIKIFNKLPIKIKNTPSNLKKFKAALKHFLNTHSFYTVDEYLM
jgi:hypothetical protein